MREVIYKLIERLDPQAFKLCSQTLLEDMANDIEEILREDEEAGK
jgi:hypothetical protein